MPETRIQPMRSRFTGVGRLVSFGSQISGLGEEEDYEVAKNSDQVWDHDTQSHLAMERATDVLPRGPAVQARKTGCQ
jgi:hypothetical protein